MYGQLSCTTANVLPAITSLTGVYKGIIKFKKTPSPNKARACANFTGAVPVDTIVAGSKYTVSWNTSSGPASSSTVHYTGAYSAVTAPTMNLNFALSDGRRHWVLRRNHGSTVLCAAQWLPSGGWYQYRDVRFPRHLTSSCSQPAAERRRTQSANGVDQWLVAWRGGGNRLAYSLNRLCPSRRRAVLSPSAAGTIGETTGITGGVSETTGTGPVVPCRICVWGPTSGGGAAGLAIGPERYRH